MFRGSELQLRQKQTEDNAGMLHFLIGAPRMTARHPERNVPRLLFPGDRAFRSTGGTCSRRTSLGFVPRQR